MPMYGERIAATRVMGGCERHNKIAKAIANSQRRTEDRRAIARSLADHLDCGVCDPHADEIADFLAGHP